MLRVPLGASFPELYRLPTLKPVKTYTIYLWNDHYCNGSSENQMKLVVPAVPGELHRFFRNISARQGSGFRPELFGRIETALLRVAVE